ncbi:YqeG family HAD IIIA-type phosphatase [Mycoplasmatota bacterium]|nr:YqeG family HAD IIIA-type phosphatase [Mycoplasmatota bacterium]
MKLFIPNEYHKTIHDIDLVKLYDSGKRLILTDLDNTLVGYDIFLPTKEIIEFKEKCEKLGMKLMIISNNKEKRVQLFAKKLDVPYHSNAMKPFKRGYKKLSLGFSTQEVVIIGDQVLTDIVGGNRMGYYTILVDVINYKNEQLKTRVNRFIEKVLYKKFKIKGEK